MNMVATAVTGRRPSRPDLRSRIVDAALGLWREVGFEAVSVDAIVSRAGVSKGAFFIFFRTKAEALAIYAEVLSHSLEPARALLDPARPLSSLDAFATAAAAVLDGEGDLARALYRELGGRAYAALTADDRAAFTALVDRAQALGVLDPDADPAVAGGALCDLWTAAVLSWAAGAANLADRVRPPFRLLLCALAG